MNTQVIFGLSALSSLVAAALWVMPKVRKMRRSEALLLLVAPHMFFRTIGLSFLVPGVVSPELPKAFSAPAAYGDFGAAILAIASILSLAKRLRWSISLVWIFKMHGPDTPCGV